MTVPVENIYYLLCYAYGHLDDLALAPSSEDLAGRIENLFAHVLLATTGRLLRRGLGRRYQEREEDVRGVRGKIRIADTLSRTRMSHGSLSCRFEELSIDLPENRIVKCALQTLSHHPQVKDAFRRKLAQTVRLLNEVTDVPLSQLCFADLALYPPRQDYSLALQISRLMAEGALPHPEHGSGGFPSFDAEPQRMGRVFEDFVRGFISVERSDARFLPLGGSWHARGSDADLSILPTLQRDIPLLIDGTRLIIECKFYTDPLVTGQFGNRKLNSSHLYQLYCYLMNDLPDARGLLLYAAAQQTLEANFLLTGRHVQVRTLNLNQPWPQVHSDMLRLLEQSVWALVPMVS